MRLAMVLPVEAGRDMQRLILAGGLLLASGCAAPSPTPPFPAFSPPPFESDRPVTVDQEALDAIITALADRVVSGDLDDVAQVIESRTSASLGIQPVSNTFGEFSDQDYVMSDVFDPTRYPAHFPQEDDVPPGERLGRYVHFGIRDSAMRPFVPTRCKSILEAADYPELRLLASVSNAHTPHSMRMTSYYDVPCDGRVRLRLFLSNADKRDPVITEVVIHAAQR